MLGGMLKRLRELVDPIGLDLTMLLAVLIAVGGVWGFVEIADEVTEGETKSFDEWAVRALRKADDPATPLGPRWLHEVGRDVTALGGVAVLVMITMAVVGFLWMQKKYHAMWVVVAATTGGLIISTLLKNLFARPRPEIVVHLSHVYTSSFPSGHSMLAAVVYLTLGALLARFIEGRWSKFYFLGIAMLLTLVVGVSRVYMGVHYPTDVLAGWTAGLAWAVVCWLVARYLQRRGAVERDVDTVEPRGMPAAPLAADRPDSR
jgi:undecaprenyl-diphosphatase